MLQTTRVIKTSWSGLSSRGGDHEQTKLFGSTRWFEGTRRERSFKLKRTETHRQPLWSFGHIVLLYLAAELLKFQPVNVTSAVLFTTVCTVHNASHTLARCETFQIFTTRWRCDERNHHNRLNGCTSFCDSVTRIKFYVRFHGTEQLHRL